MANVNVRNLPDEVHRAIRIQAAQHGRSTEAEIQAAIDDPRPSIPHKQVMAEMEAEIARLKEGNPTKHTAQQTP